MQSGTLFFWWLFFITSMTIVSITELSDGIYLNPGANNVADVNLLIHEANLTSQALNSFNSGMYSWDSLKKEYVMWPGAELLGDTWGKLSVPMEISPIITLIINLLQLCLSFIVMGGVILLEVLTGPTIFFKNLFMMFIPTPNSSTIGLIIGLLFNIVLLIDGFKGASKILAGVGDKSLAVAK